MVVLELMICTTSSYVTYGPFIVHKSTRQHFGWGGGRRVFIGTWPWWKET